MSREMVRAALDRHFERATGRPGSGLADYIQRLRDSHGVALNRQGQYRGCICGDVMCSKDTILAWCDELVASYEVKVQEFAAETLRSGTLVADILAQIAAAAEEFDTGSSWRGGMDEAARIVAGFGSET